MMDHRPRWEVRPWNTPTGRAPEAAGPVVKGLAEAIRDHREKRNQAPLQECEKWKVSTYQPEESTAEEARRLPRSQAVAVARITQTQTWAQSR